MRPSTATDLNLEWIVERTSGGRVDSTVLRVEDLAITYQTRLGEVPAVRGVNFEIERGEIHGIVGESGCGKSTVAYGIVNSLGKNGRITNGRILFQGRNLVGREEAELRALRGDRLAMVFQNPSQSLNPALRLGDQLAEVLTVHRGMEPTAAEQRCLELLKLVQMPDPVNVMQRFPHQISGGQQQRVVIAMALLNNPTLLIMDEPTYALDVTVEAAVLNLIARLQRTFDTAILYISHNLGVIAKIATTVGVMYVGEIVERGPTSAIWQRPIHPYTQGLLRSVPRLGADKNSASIKSISGQVPSPAEISPGCVFEPRCDHARGRCRRGRPSLEQVTPRRWVRCYRANEIVQRSSFPSAVPPSTLSLAHSRVEGRPLLKARQVTRHYKAPSKGLFRRPERVRALDGFNIDLRRGEALGIVGESGCGKSTLVRAIVGLERLTGGGLEFMGLDISAPLGRRSMATIREIQMVFQDPDSTLNPSYTVGAQIARPLQRFKVVTKDRVRPEVIRLLRLVRLGEHYYDRLPRQLSGGEKQRVGIARALAGRPELLLCDEPVSSLDVSVQAAVLNLLMDIQGELGTTIILVSHDLSVVRFLCDRVAVMYLGQIAEIGPAEAVYAPPYHPYTEALLSAIPSLDRAPSRKTGRPGPDSPIFLNGEVPSALDPPGGCRFHTRCPRRALLPAGGRVCTIEVAPVRETRDGHCISCHLTLEELSRVKAVVTASESRRTHHAAGNHRFRRKESPVAPEP